MSIRAGVVALVLGCAASCGKGEGGATGSGSGSPATPGALELQASKTTGEHSKDSGSETKSYALQGATLSWQRTSTDSYRQEGGDAQGIVTLTADDLDDLAREVETDHLLDGGGRKTADQTGTYYENLDVVVRADGKSGEWHLALGAADMNDPMVAVTERLIGKLDAFVKR